LKIRINWWLYIEQRFFMSWATIWRSKARDAAIKNK
jgi:predicted metalloendopeptidase